MRTAFVMGEGKGNDERGGAQAAAETDSLFSALAPNVQPYFPTSLIQYNHAGATWHDLNLTKM